jgi:hypothetical protein
MPVLVLDAAKIVVLANEAMGRLLDIDPSELENDDGPVATVMDILQGQHMAHLGIEILAHGSPILVSWDVCSTPLLLRIGDMINKYTGISRWRCIS